MNGCVDKPRKMHTSSTHLILFFIHGLTKQIGKFIELVDAQMEAREII